MRLDVQDLQAFYYRSALGRAAQRAVRNQMQAFWPEAKAQTVVGYGFATGAFAEMAALGGRQRLWVLATGAILSGYVATWKASL